jgi:hypothetical protein
MISLTEDRSELERALKADENARQTKKQSGLATGGGVPLSLNTI